MKYLVMMLVVFGCIGTAFGQNMGESSDEIWLPNCPIGTGTECDKSSLFPNAISNPFFQSDSVAIGTIVEKEFQDQTSLRYSINVDFYLKNYQPFDLITATLNDAPEPQTLPEVFWYNSPVFNEGDLVFVYLKKSDGQYKVLPESFSLDKHEVRGPPPTIHWNNGPSEDVFEQGEKILVSGEVRKVELVKAAKEGKQIDAKLMIVESDDRDNMVFSDLMKIEPDAKYNYAFDTTKIPPGKYELEVNYGPSTYGNGITIKPNFKIWTPLKQSNFGISNEEIQCRENLVLIQKYDGSPACVKPNTKLNLIERGWTGKAQATQESLVERFSNLPEVVAFYETYEDAKVLVQNDHVSYFSGSDDDYFVRMNLIFDETYTIKDIDFYCYFQKTHQYELPQEDVSTRIAKYDCKEYVKTTPEPQPETETEWVLYDAKKSLQNAYQTNVNLGSFYMKDVIVGFGTYDDTLIIDIPLQYTNSIQIIKKEVQNIVGDQVKIDYAIYDEPIERHISTVIPYLWNKVLHQKQVDFTPKNQTYWNNAEGFAEHDRVCSPLVATNGTEFYISSTFDLEPFEITGTFIDKTKPDDCHKIWKTEVIMQEPDRVTALWLEHEK